MEIPIPMKSNILFYGLSLLPRLPRYPVHLTYLTYGNFSPFQNTPRDSVCNRFPSLRNSMSLILTSMSIFFWDSWPNKIILRFTSPTATFQVPGLYRHVFTFWSYHYEQGNPAI